MAEADAYVLAVAEWLMAAGFAVDTSVVHDNATEAILDEAAFRNADLIVMATHGRGGLGRGDLGSVADAVLRRSRVPLLLVRSRQIGAVEVTAGVLATRGTALAQG